MLKIVNFQIVIRFFVILTILFFFSTGVDAKKARQAFERGLFILSPASLTNVLPDVIREFSQKNNISISVAFDSTSELSSQIEDGEPANIFISEDPLKMKDLQQKGLLNVFSISNLFQDRLVLVCPNNHFLIKKLSKLKNMEEKLEFVSKNSLIAIPDPELDRAGVLSKQAFENLGLWEKMKDKIVRAGNTQNAFYLAAQGNTPAIMYLSDVKNNDRVTVIGRIPEKLYDKIIYQVAIVADITSASSANDAEKFIRFLKENLNR